MPLHATPAQLEQLIETAEDLEAHVRKWADLLAELSGADGWPYDMEIDDMKASMGAFNTIRRQIEESTTPAKGASNASNA